MDNKTKNAVSPMALLTYFHNIDDCHLNMTAGEKVMMSVLITRVDNKLSNGYESFPAGDYLVKRTGLSIKTIERFRKSLLEAGWIKIISGKGKGNSNHYFINAARIMELYNLCNKKQIVFDADGLGIVYTKIENKLSNHARNTAGLTQNKPITKQAKQSIEPRWYDDDLEPPF